MSETGSHRSIVERDYPAPRELVFEAWTAEDRVTEWFAPPGFTVTKCELDPRVDSTWHIEYADPNEHAYSERGTYRAVDAPSLLSFTLTQVDGTFVGPETLIEVTLEGTDGHTHMRFEQSGFPSPQLRDVNEEGWRECFDKLAATLARMASATD